MAAPVLLDATPLAEGHAQRGIGVALSGLLEGFRGFDEDERPVLLTRAGGPTPAGFLTQPVRWPGLQAPRLPDLGPPLVGTRAARRRSQPLFHATRAELIPSGPGVIATCYDLIPALYPNQYLAGPSRIAERRAYRRYLSALSESQLIITPSEETADDVGRLLNIPTARLRVVPLGTPPLAAPSADRPPGPYLLYSGALDPHKNPELAIDVLAATRPEVTLVMTGPWAPRRLAALEERVRAADVEDRVRWFGWRSSEEMAGLRAGAAAALITSRKEGFGLPVLEAMAAGTPVIAADIPALRETGGDAAEYRDLGLVGGWADAVHRLLDEPTHAARLAAAGRRRAAEFTWEKTASAVRDVWREALDA